MYLRTLAYLRQFSQGTLNWVFLSFAMKRVLAMIFVSMWRVFCLDDPKQRPRRAVYTITLWLNHIPWEVINFRIIREYQSWETTQHNLFTTWQINLKWPTGTAWAGSMETHTSPRVKQIASGRLPRNTGSSAWCPVTASRGGLGVGCEGGDVCFLMADYVVVQQKHSMVQQLSSNWK